MLYLDFFAGFDLLLLLESLRLNYQNLEKKKKRELKLGIHGVWTTYSILIMLKILNSCFRTFGFNCLTIVRYFLRFFSLRKSNIFHTTLQTVHH